MVKDELIIPAAFEAGINFFFVSADLHWPSYRKTREGLRTLLSVRGRRDDVVIAAVSYPTQAEFCEGPFQELLEEVPELERIDVLLAGGAFGDEIERRLSVYKRHRSRTRFGARAIGVTFHDRQACAHQLRAGELDVAFARYNPGHAGAQVDLFPALVAPHAPLFTFKSTFGWVSPERAAKLSLPPSLWLPAITDHYRFALSSPAVDGLLVGFTRVAEVRELSDALAAGGLDPDEQMHLQYLAELERGLYQLVENAESTQQCDEKV
jgi:hypothetical protein